MRTHSMILRVMVVAALGALAVLALRHGDRREMIFRPIASAHRGGGQFSAQVRNGIDIPDPARDFPAALAVDAYPFCSATLVGRDAMLTAEHCVFVAAQTGQRIAVEVAQKKLTVVCNVFDRGDVALCKLSEAVDTIVFDPIARRIPAVNDAAILTGWAETPTLFSPRVWLNLVAIRLGLFHPFRYGPGRVVAVGPLLNIQGERTAGGPVVLEEGDSGGAAYDSRDQRRQIIGVNVCGGSRCGGIGGANDGTTTLTNLAYEPVAMWIMTWANDHDASVCGFRTGKGCRS